MSMMASAAGGEMQLPMYNDGGSMQAPYDPGVLADSRQLPTGPAMETYNGTMADGGAEASDKGSNGGGHAAIDKETGIAPRRCTDVQCCFYFLFGNIVLLSMLAASRWYGNVNALTHGRDYYGRICGIDAGVENMPWLYWCRGDAPKQGIPDKLQMYNPSCVAACPMSFNATVKIPCLIRASHEDSKVPGGQFGNMETQEVIMQESIILTTPYATRPRGGRFCIPQNPTLEKQLLESWDGLHPFGIRMTMVNAGTLGHLGWIFFVVTLVAILSGFLFYFLIKFAPKQLTCIFTYPAAILCAICAFWLLGAVVVLINRDNAFSVRYMAEWNPLYSHYSWTNASILSIVISLFMWICACMLGGMGYNFDGAMVGDLINAGMECMKSVPGMMYLPILEALVKFLIFIFFLDGLRWFFTVGIMHKNRIHINGARFAGLSRVWTYNPWWVLAVILWIAGFAWWMEIANCFFQYVISKGTIAYYYTPKENGKKKMKGATPIPGGIKEALLYHFGSVAYGAFYIPTWRPFRLMYWASSEITPGEGNSKTCLGKALGCLGKFSCGWCGLQDCCGIKEWSKQYVICNEAAIKDGFSDVCVRANDFDPASVKAHMLLEHSHKVVQYVYRDLSQCTLCVLGVTGIASISAWVAFLIVMNARIYTSPSSTLYIANPYLTVFLAWILAAYIGFGFMSAWDHTADTLLYCYTWNRKFSRQSVERYIPENVRAIVGWDDKEDDRYPYYGRAKTNMYLRSWIPIGDKSVKKQAVEEKKLAQEEKAQASWFQPGSWYGSQPPMPPPGAPQEMQSLIPK